MLPAFISNQSFVLILVVCETCVVVVVDGDGAKWEVSDGENEVEDGRRAERGDRRTRKTLAARTIAAL